MRRSARSLPPFLRLTLIAGRPRLRGAVYRALDGRYWDPDDPSKGRLTRADVAEVLDRMWMEFDRLLPGSGVERLPTAGSRLNVLLGVLSLAFYRALVSLGLQPRHATSLFTDAAWLLYRDWIWLPRLVVRVATRDEQRQIELMVRMFLHFPFGRPGYEWRARRGPVGFETDFTRCPVLDYMRAHGEDEFMRNSWCTLDFALAQAMVPGGRYQRRNTLSAGDPVCDMRWRAAPRS
jgi:hypothetical protein